MKAYTDGACRGGNPGHASCAFAIFLENYAADLVKQFSTYLGPDLHTNNYAEYQGLIHLLDWAQTSGTTKLEIFCDSKLIVNQVSGVWKVEEPEISKMWMRAYGLCVRGRHTLQHVKGHSGNPGNEYVDKLCNIALDEVGL
jgi:ribonuclease HI